MPIHLAGGDIRPQGIVVTIRGGGELLLYSKLLCRIGTIPVEEGTSIIRVGSNLVMGGRQGITVFDLSNPRHPQSNRFMENISVTALGSPLGKKTGSFVV